MSFLYDNPDEENYYYYDDDGNIVDQDGTVYTPDDNDPSNPFSRRRHEWDDCYDDLGY